MFDPKRKECSIDFFETLEFVLANDAKPFAFVRDLFQLRAEMKAHEKATGIYNSAEKNIKLTVNSIYGKMAQKIGGHRGMPPVCANPYYAAAITSWCRRKLMEACLKDPEAVIMMATDGTISTRPLDLDIGKGLGQWECSEATGGLFLQSGVYFYLKEDETGEDKRFVNRLRGSSKKSIGGKKLRDEIIAGALLGWSTPVDELPDGHYVDNPVQGRQPAIPLEQKSCVTAGNSVRNEAWDRVCGRFAVETRMLNVHTLGTKRALSLDPMDWETVRNPDGSLRLARRCSGLISSSARSNPRPHILSAPLYPKWVEKAPETPEDPETDDGVFQELHEQAELFEGVRARE